MINVVTVYASKPGNLEHTSDASAYGPEHVARLRDAFHQHLTVPHDFFCLSDATIADTECLPLEHGWGGWWSKLEVFAHLWDGPVLYCDLDNVILGNVDELTNPREGFVGALDWDYPIFNSSLMHFDGDYRWIYQAFCGAPETFAKIHDHIPMLGDQSFIASCLHSRDITPLYWQRILPEGYLGSRRELDRLASDNPPRAVLWHGYPKPWQMSEQVRSLLYP